MTAIIASIIGLIGIVLGAIIQAFAPQITNRFLSHNDAHIFTGNWKCHWQIMDIEYTDIAPIDDVVEITKVVGNKIIGKGIGSVHGSYVIEGRVSPFAISFLYYGVGKTINQTGVIILKRSDLTNQMTGNWYQYLDNKFLIGTTFWEKIDN